MNHTSKGYIFLLLSVFCFAAMSLLVKLAAGIPASVIVLFRFGVGITVLGLAALLKLISFNFSHRLLLLARGLTGSIAVFCFYFSISKIGIGKATVINYSYPVFASLISMWLLREKVSFVKWVLITSAFLGVLLISTCNIGSHGKIIIGLYEGIALTGAIFSSVSVVIVRKLHKTDNSYSIFYAQTLIGFAVYAFPGTGQAANISPSVFFLLAGIGILAMTGQLTMTQGYKYVNVSSGALLQLLVPVINVFAGVLFFNEILEPIEWFGAFIILSSSALVIYLNHNQKG